MNAPVQHVYEKAVMFERLKEIDVLLSDPNVTINGVTKEDRMGITNLLANALELLSR